MRKFIDHFLIVLIPLFLGLFVPTLAQYEVLNFVGSWNERELYVLGFVVSIAGWKTYTWIRPGK